MLVKSTLSVTVATAFVVTVGVKVVVSVAITETVTVCVIDTVCGDSIHEQILAAKTSPFNINELTAGDRTSSVLDVTLIVVPVDKSDGEDMLVEVDTVVVAITVVDVVDVIKSPLFFVTGGVKPAVVTVVVYVCENVSVIVSVFVLVAVVSVRVASTLSTVMLVAAMAVTTLVAVI